MKADLKIALRDSTIATRPYVLVNPLQAKHLPSVPSVTLQYFMRLGEKVAATCKGERTLVIGFAETATAIGAAVASAIENAVYVHTTRETMLPASPRPSEPLRLVTDFLEEHSHAKEQALYLSKSFGELSAYDRLVFVEDEITTGKTILNFLRCTGYNGKITVSALVFNGFDGRVFSHYKADFVCLQEVGYVRRLEFEALPNPRSGVEISVYCDRCLELAARIVLAVDESDVLDRDVLVIGTEEFMYPALVLGRELEKTARSVKSHSTTRSPLLPQNRDNYPIYNRYDFASLYDPERTTYLYNLEKYDTVIIITDAPDSDSEEIARTLLNCGNQKIYFLNFVRARDAG